MCVTDSACYAGGKAVLPPSTASTTYPTVANTTNPELSDDELALRGAAGDGAAFVVLVERYKRPVYALAYRILGNSADAEDAAQETFVRAYTRLSTYQPGGRFGSWLLAITSHWCIDHLRRRRSVSLDSNTALGGFLDKGELPEALALRSERQNEVRQWLLCLPEAYRLVLILRYWHDLSYAEISTATGLPVSTVRMRLFRARQLLMRQRGEQRAALTTAFA
jgi:RNA polymerase sigma-70 factor, ECF subfamily